VEDILSLSPRIKTCESDVVCVDAMNLLNNSKRILAEGNYALAFELAQEAANLSHQVH
jgi:hypothetical protein